MTSWRARARWPLWPTREPGRCLEAPSWSMACFAPLGPWEPDFFSDCVSGKVGQLSRAATALDATALNKWVPAVPRPLPRRPLPRRAATDICGRPHTTATRRSSGGLSALDGASTGTILRCAAACASRGRSRRRRLCCFGRPRRRHGAARHGVSRYPRSLLHGARRRWLCRRPAAPPSFAHASSSHVARAPHPRVLVHAPRVMALYVSGVCPVRMDSSDDGHNARARRVRPPPPRVRGDRGQRHGGKPRACPPPSIPEHMPWASFHGVISVVSCLQNLGYTALHCAAYWGRLAITELLLELGADPTLRCKDGKTALDYAREEGKSEVVALLSEPRYAR